VTCLVGECSDYSWKDAAVDFGVGGFSWGVSNLSKLRYLKQAPKLAAAVRVAGEFGLGVAGEVTRRELKGEAYTLEELAWGSAVTTAIGEAGELGARGVGLFGRWAASRLAASDSAIAQFLAQDVGELFRGGGRHGAAALEARRRVLSNIAASRRSREASRFQAYVAREAQALAGYAPDIWDVTTLRKGSILMGGVPGQSAFYTDVATVIASRLSGNRLWELLQVRPHPIFGFRPAVRAYRLTRDLRVAIGRALANPDAGVGGGVQIFLRYYDRALEPIRTFSLVY